MSRQVFHRFIINGAPGSGKGTISSWITRDFPIKHTSAGDLLRNQISNATDDGKQASQYIKKGQLVPDELVTKLMLRELHKLSDHHLLLDGFPRTLKQVMSLEEEIKLSRVLDIHVPPDEIIKRISGRLIHQKSGRVYNIHFNPPKVEGKDDITGEDLTTRDDDKPSVVKERLNAYSDMTEPILDHYRKRGILARFTGSTSYEIYDQMKPFLQQYTF